MVLVKHPLAAIAAAWAMCLALAGPVAAQTSGSGTITGTLIDTSGAVVPDAQIVVHNVATNADRSATTTNAGTFAVTFLPPGPYDVTAAKGGFATVVRKDLVLQVGQTLTVELQLPVQAVQETVTVVAETPQPLIDPEQTEVSQVVSKSMVENLPIVGRRWDNFALLTPGITTDGTLVSYRGISGLYNSNMVDGANNNQAFFSQVHGRATVPYSHSLDSIQEFQVSASNYSAEFGQAAGGIVNAVTKSGTNAMHGDLVYFLRHPSLNALDPVAKAAGIYTQPVRQQHQFGGSLGGPLVRDKLFYFATYDGFRKSFPITFTSSATFPLACPAPVSAAQCAAANTFLTSLTGSYPRNAVQDLGFGKLDYQLNPANRVSTSVNIANFFAPHSFSNASLLNNSLQPNGSQTTQTRFLVSSWDSIVGSNVVNSLRFQWGRDNEFEGANAGGPGVSIAGVMAYGQHASLPRPAFPDERRLQFADNLSITRGGHRVKVGVDVNLIHERLANLFQGNGAYSYTGAPAVSFGNWVADVYGVDLGDGLTGRHYASFTQATDPITGIGKDEFSNNDFAAYVEDSWKVRPNMTLNLGLRYDLQLIPQPPQPNTTTPLLTQLTSRINTDTNNVGPRIGLAWEPLKDTVVRAGYGMFYGKTTNSTFYTVRVQNGIYQQQFNCAPRSACAPNFPNLIFTPVGPAPSAPFAGAIAPQVINTNPPLGALATHGLADDFANPLIHEGEVALERAFPGNVALSVNYVFSRALHLPIFIDANVAPASTTRSYAILNAGGGLDQIITLPFYTQRLEPQTGVIQTGYSDVNGWYHGLILTLRRPLRNGLEALVNYTYSKAVDYGARAGQFGTFNGTDSPLDPGNLTLEKGLSELDQRHRFTGSVIWEPFASGSTPPLPILLDGWSLSSIVTVASGQPVQSNVSGFPSNGVNGGLTGAVISNSAGPTGGRAPQFDRNEFIGPGVVNVDVRAMRTIALGERTRVQLFAEAFNLFNRSNLVISGMGLAAASNYVAVGGSGCPASAFGATNGCLIPNAAFMRPSTGTSLNGLYAPRQFQLGAKILF